MVLRFALAIVLFLPSLARAEASLSAGDASALETVFRWADQRCDDNWIPDSPARAYRRRDGGLVLMASHYTNGVLEGRDFGGLRPNCAVVAKGKEDPDPAAFDDRLWIQALVPAADGKVLGVVSHEYMGARHPGRCGSKARRDGNNCWYSSLLLAEADERDFLFRLLPGRGRILAAPPVPFDSKADRRVGFFTASNVVRSGDWNYLVSWTELPGGAFGNCLFRAPAGDPSAGWAALRGGAFDAAFAAPHAEGAERRPSSCDIVGRGSLLNVVRSVVRLERAGVWVATFIMPGGHGTPEGVYYATSPDLVRWDRPRFLFDTASEPDAKGCRVVYQYPSLIDHNSASGVFDTAPGDGGLHLYLTRFNRDACQRWLNRDLVRVRVEARP